MPALPVDLRGVLDELDRWGILLESDAKLPSVAGLVAGGPVKGSWWGHARSHAIWRVLTDLSDRQDVLVTKLVSGKVSFVDRKLWPAVFTVGRARDTWQLADLSREAQSLLDMVSREGALETDQIPWRRGAKRQSPGEAARELERRLLVYGEEFHTSTGAHAKRLETWEHWARRVGFSERKPALKAAKKKLEEALLTLNKRHGAAGRLPWSHT